MSILQGLQSIWEKFCHFFRGFHIILAALITHSVLVCQFLVCLQTEKNIMRISILRPCIMHIIGCNKVNPCFFVHTEKFLIYQSLRRDSMIL